MEEGDKWQDSTLIFRVNKEFEDSGAGGGGGGGFDPSLLSTIPDEDGGCGTGAEVSEAAAAAATEATFGGPYRYGYQISTKVTKVNLGSRPKIQFECKEHLILDSPLKSVFPEVPRY